ncbi:MAG TPA: PHB depolymerase family esterase [Albitalea sp.]|nr:PHB depolymerase family esterase [Albitalea sp.]
MAWLSAFGASAADGRQTLVHQGTERSYVVRLPNLPGAPDQRLPLVLVLHGGGGDAANAEAMTGFTEAARREGFIVVYPEGSGRLKGRLLTWNAGHCCGRAMERRVDDVDFIRTLIARLQADYPVDPRRIYVTGMSNGGMMTHRLGIELSDRVAAIAPVVATLFGDEKKPSHAVPALMINGQTDTHVPPAGGAPGGRFSDAWDGTPAQPAAAQGSFWAAANGCTAQPETRDEGPLLRTRYRCTPGREVELLLVKDNGHAWPGGRAGSRRGDTPSTAVNATELIWSFFKAHSK